MNTATGDLRNNRLSARNGRTWHEVAAAARQCGDCSMCCKVPPIEELSKPAHQWCQHVKPGSGCAIYEARPAVCRGFVCGWLVLDMGPHWKPTKCKMVVVRKRDRQSGGRELIVQPDRNFPNAWRRSPYYEELKEQCGQIKIEIVLGDGRCVLMCPDQDVYFDPTSEVVMFDGAGRFKSVLPIEEARNYLQLSIEAN
jgi:Fe-S-cluster containining protein